MVRVCMQESNITPGVEVGSWESFAHGIERESNPSANKMLIASRIFRPARKATISGNDVKRHLR